MIRALVDFALGNRMIVLAMAILMFVWGVIAFRNLPVEAYPDVANNYVQVITQWPGISAEQIEQQVTIPLEIAMNGIPHLEHLRSTSLFGLSSVMLIFDDDSEDDWNRVKVLERLSRIETRVEDLPSIKDRIAKLEAFGYQVSLQPPDIRPKKLLRSSSAGCCRLPSWGNSRISR